MKLKGGICATLAAIGEALLARGTLRVFPHSTYTFGGYSPVRGATPANGGTSQSAYAWTVISNRYTNDFPDAARAAAAKGHPVYRSYPYTLQSALAHELDHLNGQFHVPYGDPVASTFQRPGRTDDPWTTANTRRCDGMCPVVGRYIGSEALTLRVPSLPAALPAVPAWWLARRWTTVLRGGYFMLLHVAAGCRSACVLAVAAVALAAGACDRSVGTPAPVAGAVNALPYVGAAAAGALDADGRFLLAAPPKLSRPQISEDQAKALAVAFIRKFGQFSRASFEQVHGAPIDFATLRAADRVYYAAAPYEQTVPETFHPARIKRTGPYYLVPLIAADRPVLSVAVSAYNTNINIGPDGLVRFPAMAGNDFDPLPAPLDREFSMPVSPERAAQIVFEATGRRVVAPPQLLLPDLRYAAHFARWKLRLDGPATVHGVKTRTAYRASELYVGRYAELSVALPVQPAGIAVVDPAIGATITAARVADAPVHFETVNPASRQ